MPMSTLTVLSKALAVTMSGMPSPVRSATATENGCRPVAKVVLGREADALIVPAQVHQHADGVAGRVGDDDVGPAVAGEVGHRQRIGLVADREDLLRLEGAVAVAHEHADRVVCCSWR